MIFSGIESSLVKNLNKNVKLAEDQLDRLAKTMGEKSFSQHAAQFLISRTMPGASLPQSLKKFSEMTQDGVAILLAEPPYNRLKQVILDQLGLPEQCETGERLLHLAFHYPTLQKLGQIIARSPSIADEVKRWLTPLEGQDNPADTYGVRSYLRHWLDTDFPSLYIDISETILAKASVAEVVRFSQYDKNRELIFCGVFKVLKPGIEVILRQELQILEKILQYFENKRRKYCLENMKIAHLFNTVRKDLEKEVDLLAEQHNLLEAKEVYRDNDRIHIPELKDFGNSRITAMEYMAGIKITDIKLQSSQRLSLAHLLFKALICKPLFQHREKTLFHGDPHAGNILAIINPITANPDVALLDWTLAGHLSRNTRIYLIQLLLGVITDNPFEIAKAIAQLADKDDSLSRGGNLSKRIQTHMLESEYDEAQPLRRSFWLLEKLTMDGVLFSAELILFRKAFFTLEGVLNDLCPGFAMETAMEGYVAKIVLQEIPHRLSTGIIPQNDGPADYQSMLSNQDLGKIAFHQSLDTYKQVWKHSCTLIETQTRLANDFLGCFTWFRS